MHKIIGRFSNSNSLPSRLPNFPSTLEASTFLSWLNSTRVLASFSQSSLSSVSFPSEHLPFPISSRIMDLHSGKELHQSKEKEATKKNNSQSYIHIPMIIYSINGEEKEAKEKKKNRPFTPSLKQPSSSSTSKSERNHFSSPYSSQPLPAQQ